MKQPFEARKALADHYRGLRRRIGARAARAHWKIDRRDISTEQRAWLTALYEAPGGLSKSSFENFTTSMKMRPS